MNDIRTLAPKKWLGLYLIEFFLLYHWYQQSARAGVRFVDSLSLGETNETFEVFVRPRFRRRYFLPVDGQLPHEPVAYCLLGGADPGQLGPVAVHQGIHHVVVVQDVSRRRVTLLGVVDHTPTFEVAREFWKNGGGWDRYRQVCDLHGWDAPAREDDVEVMAVSPPQNGYDCGIVAIQVVMGLYNGSLFIARDGSIPVPALPCGHRTRLNVYNELRVIFVEMNDYYHAMRSNPPDEWSTWSVGLESQVVYGVRDEWMTKIKSLQKETSVEKQLERSVEQCSDCRGRNRRPPGVRAVRFAVLDNAEAERTQDRSRAAVLGFESKRADRTSALPSSRLKTQRITNAELVRVGEAEEEEYTGDFEDPVRRGRSRLLPRRIKPYSITTNGGFPFDFNSRVSAVAFDEDDSLIPLPKGRLWPSRDLMFDTYFSGPTLEDIRSLEDPVVTFPGNPYAALPIKSPWSYFRDYGYRLDPSFAHMFYLQRPVKVCAGVRSHVLRC